MPEPTPTVIVTASDRRLAEKILMPRQVVGVRRHQQPTIDLLAAEIAAAREAWGVPREAVAALVEAAERYRIDSERVLDWMNGNDVCADHQAQDPEGFAAISESLPALYAALERVKG